MKTKAQKQEELRKAEELLGKSKALLFLNFSGIDTSKLRELRKAVRSIGGSLMVIKKRLLNVLFKDKNIAYDARQFDGSVGTVFSEVSHETISGPVYKFFTDLPETETQKKTDNVKKILGGYNLEGAQAIDAATVVAIGQLPPREVLLAHVLGAIAAPIRAFLYVLQQKAAQGGGVVIPGNATEESKEQTQTVE